MPPRKADRPRSEHALEGFAEDLGRLLGAARGRADRWLEQRQTIAKNLEQIRDTASSLLTQLGQQAKAVAGRGRTKPVYAPAPVSRRKRRKMSAKARKAISDAQKARWARQKRDQKGE
jgi:hypothetical protein